MVWKQDLAKLKQKLGSEPAPAAPKPPPKPTPKASAGPIEDEDAVFLAAMGLKSAVPKKPVPPPEAGPSASPAAEPPVPETFEEALRDLKGLKPLPKELAKRARPAAKEPAPSPATPASAAPQPEPERLTPVPSPPPEPIPSKAAPAETRAQVTAKPAPVPALPIQFQLAAGMALEVDATLDLRGHSLVDALERLKDRLGDGQLLGWRVLQVTLGSDPMLHEGLLGLLNSGKVPMVVRYAQAPVPMGGNQAWLLYLGTAAPAS